MKTFLLKLDTDIYLNWKQQATASGLTLSEWIRRKCNGASELLSGEGYQAKGKVKPPKATPNVGTTAVIPARPAHALGCPCAMCSPQKEKTKRGK